MHHRFYKALQVITYAQKRNNIQAAIAVLLFISLFISGSVNSSAQTNSWSRKANFGGKARDGAVGFSIGNKGYIGTGDFMKDFWEYDPPTGIWTQKADFGGGKRSYAVGFSIGNKGYIGTGYAGLFDKRRDFWEYDPAANAWTQKADFGGTARMQSVGFSIGNKGYIGTGSDAIDSEGETKDFWEYDPVTDTWTRKADVGGRSRQRAAGFSIGTKGYIGTGWDNSYNLRKDFWEYDPVNDNWTRKADFGGGGCIEAVGFSIGSKGYLGTGIAYPNYYKDFWEYDPTNDAWTRKADFGGAGRRLAVGFSIGSKGYIGTGSSGYPDYTQFKDFWEYTPDSCLDPVNLRVPKISDTCARLNWNVPGASVEHIKISYRALGASGWIEDRKKSLENSKVICGLTPNTTYEWKLRNICADEKTGWVIGPNFTTLPSTGFVSNAFAGNSIKSNGNFNAQIIPNPSKGNFTVQMHLPGNASFTTLSLCNSTGEKIWQQDAGRLSGSASIHIALENKLLPGLYVLVVQRGEERIMQKVLVMK